MADSQPKILRVRVGDSQSTKAAQEVLAAQTRAFGNASAKLQLQMASASFLLKKQQIEAANLPDAEPQEQE